MRIIAGEWRGRRIKAPPDRKVRPTADRVREAWMSILQQDLPGSRVVDLFAGSGALGLEALSRGADSVTFVEVSRRVLETLQANAEALGAADRITTLRGDALRFVETLSEGAFDLALADPPYGDRMAHALAERWLDRPFSTVLSLEHSSRETLPGSPDVRRYGDTAVSFYRC